MSIRAGGARFPLAGAVTVNACVHTQRQRDIYMAAVLVPGANAAG